MARILYVSAAESPHDARFLRKFASAGHDVWFLPCTRAGERKQESIFGIRRLSPLSGNPLSPGNVHWLKAAMKFRSVLARVKPDLIHAGPVHTGAFFAAVENFHPFVAVSWGSDVLLGARRSRWTRCAARFALRRANLILADCTAVREQIANWCNDAHARMISFPWGVEKQWFVSHAADKKFRDELGWQDCKIAIAARGFEPIHQPFVILAALKASMQRHPTLRAIMLGDGSLRCEAEDFISHNDLSSQIYLPGQVSEAAVHSYFAAADFYICATQCDGASVSLLQAMASRLPVIVPNAGGNPEWVRHGENGWLFEAASEVGLTECIDHALSEASRWPEIGAANQVVVHERADWNRNFEMLLNAYEDLLANRSAERKAVDALLQNWKPLRW